MERLTILYGGTLVPDFTAEHRLRALRDLGHDVLPLELGLRLEGHGRLEALAERIGRRLYVWGIDRFGYRDLAGANAALLRLAARVRPDVVWLDKALTITRATLLRLREGPGRPRIVGYSPDDMAQRHNNSRPFREHLPAYDCFFTTKSYNVAELKAWGCPEVRFVGNGFDPHTHRPMPRCAAERRRLGGPVGFIGFFEPDRAASVEHLAACGLPVRVWGSRWRSYRPRNPGLTVEPRAIYGDDYAAAISNFDINLCFLRRRNRDLQTTRSVEIPACGGFMLAERTDEHLALFEEGREAEYFGSDDELVDKARFYLAHDEARRRVAAAGRERCLKIGYSNVERMRGMLAVVAAL